MVAASYITIYLAIIFLVVANTVMGVQFLMNQQKTGRRYLTLVRLGATYETICNSAGKQIVWFMGLPVFVAAVSSHFGVKALYTGILSSQAQGTQGEMLMVSAAMIFLLCVVEYIYVTVIKRSSDRYLLTLMQPQREE
jgi:putative ABC transport system permease protein